MTMSVEILGFIAGIGCAAAGGLVFLKLEAWRGVGSFNSRRSAATRGGNALIWPSH
jgi:hypothetical protein